MLLIGILFAFLLNTFVIKMYKIPSASMESTMQEGDYIMASPLFNPPSEIDRGEIVVFNIPETWNPTYPNELYVKRVIGVGGDHVVAKGDGSSITINGVPIDETYIKPGVTPSDVAFDYVVPAGEIFVLGDNRPNSQDSRYHKDDPFIAVGAVVNTPNIQLWPLNRAKVYPDASSVFANVPDAG